MLCILYYEKLVDKFNFKKTTIMKNLLFILSMLLVFVACQKEPQNIKTKPVESFTTVLVEKLDSVPTNWYVMFKWDCGNYEGQSYKWYNYSIDQQISFGWSTLCADVDTFRIEAILRDWSENAADIPIGSITAVRGDTTTYYLATSF